METLTLSDTHMVYNVCVCVPNKIMTASKQINSGAWSGSYH